jgi:hypothetical protein
VSALTPESFAAAAGVDALDQYRQQARELLAEAIDVRSRMERMLWRLSDLQGFTDVVCGDRDGIGDTGNGLAYEMSETFGVGGACDVIIATADLIGDRTGSTGSHLRSMSSHSLRQRFAHLLEGADETFDS